MSAGMNVDFLADKVVLITGGTGSFGREAVKQLLKTDVRKLIVFSRGEYEQFRLRSSYDDDRLRFFIGDVRDRDRLRRAFNGVDYILHAAALKQVPVCEYCPAECVKTNVLGSMNVVDAAIDCGVEKVVAIGSDKLVDPSTVYGTTKLCAEKLFVQGNAYSFEGGPRFACVRYGNVVGSRGSVIEVFRKQRGSGRVTITDKRMTRFWLTIGKGVQFVLRRLEMMQGGEVYVPRVPSMKIVDLANVVAPGCEQIEIGIRPGEKLHEMLISANESRQALKLPDGSFVIEPAFPWWEHRSTGEPLPDGFSYASDTNDWWLSADDLREMLGKKNGYESSHHWC